MFSTIAMSKVTKVILEEILKKIGKNKKMIRICGH